MFFIFKVSIFLSGSRRNSKDEPEASRLCENKQICNIRGQQHEAVQPVQPLVDCENWQQNRRHAEHDRNIPAEQTGRKGIRFEKAAEAQDHEEVEEIAADYVARQYS